MTKFALAYVGLSFMALFSMNAHAETTFTCVSEFGSTTQMKFNRNWLFQKQVVFGDTTYPLSKAITSGDIVELMQYENGWISTDWSLYIPISLMNSSSKTGSVVEEEMMRGTFHRGPDITRTTYTCTRK